MQTVDNNVERMTHYLKHALEFEKFVHIWSSSMAEVNQRMENIYQTRRYLQTAKSEKGQTKANLANAPAVDHAYTQSLHEAERYERKSKKVLRNLIIALVSIVVLSLILAISVCNSHADTMALPRILAIPFIMLGVLIPTLPILLLICIPQYIASKNKASKYRENAHRQGNTRSKERQLLILAEEETQIDNQLIVLSENEAALSVQQEHILSNLREAQTTLAQIYAVNILPVKYRNICAVATMYEYLATGRVDTITGHGGMYDTYETEKIQLAQLQQMVMTNQHLSRMEDQQRYICQELTQANQSLHQIKSSLVDIQATNQKIADNTALTAEYSRQTAENTNWMVSQMRYW